jgi:hypothetical protein
MNVVRLIFLHLLLAATVLAGTPGVFRGTLFQTADDKPGWVYVESRNGALRRVEISKAQVVYSEEVPAPKRQKISSHAVPSGTEVRITAEQDSHGEWRASEIEILLPRNK